MGRAIHIYIYICICIYTIGEELTPPPRKREQAHPQTVVEKWPKGNEEHLPNATAEVAFESGLAVAAASTFISSLLLQTLQHVSSAAKQLIT